MKLTNAFYKIAEMTHKNKAIQGSKGASKTFSILQRWLLMSCCQKDSQLCSIVSDTLPNLKTGAIRDFERICNTEGLTVQSTKVPYVFIVNNWTFEFFSVDKENKGLGGRRDRLFINESNRISWKIARQLIGRTHRECIFDYNPVEAFWVHSQFVDVNDCDFVKLTYKDNQYLPQAEIEAIEKHAPWGSVPDENFWRVYGLGEIGFTENMIFKDFETYDELPDNVDLQISVGVDWGGDDPMTAIAVHIDEDNKSVYWKELFYASEAMVEDMYPYLQDYKDYPFYCDHNPKQHIWELINKGGFEAYRAKKGELKGQIKALKQYNIFVHEDSKMLLKEIRNYKYKEVSGEVTFYPDQKCDDHAMDAARYGTLSPILY